METVTNAKALHRARLLEKVTASALTTAAEPLERVADLLEIVALRVAIDACEQAERDALDVARLQGWAESAAR